MMLGEKISDCPNCENGKLKTNNSRPSKCPDSIRRRAKKCLNCGVKFYTEEMVISGHGFGADELYNKTRKFSEDLNNLLKTHFGEQDGGLSRVAMRKPRALKGGE